MRLPDGMSAIPVATSVDEWAAALRRRRLGDPAVPGGFLDEDNLLSAASVHSLAVTAIPPDMLDEHLRFSAWRRRHPDVRLAGRCIRSPGGSWITTSPDGQSGQTVDRLPPDVDPRDVLEIDTTSEPIATVRERVEALLAIIGALEDPAEPERAAGTREACRNALRATAPGEEARRWDALRSALAAMRPGITPSALLSEAVRAAAQGYELRAATAPMLAAIRILQRLDEVGARADTSGHPRWRYHGAVPTLIAVCDDMITAVGELCSLALRDGMAGHLRDLADACLDEATAHARGALDAEGFDGFYLGLHAAAPFALAAQWVHGVVCGFAPTDAALRARNNAEEWKVRMADSFAHGIDFLDSPVFAEDRLAVEAARQRGGDVAAVRKARELCSIALLYPKVKVPELLGEEDRS